MQPFRFAVQSAHAPDPATWRERARKAEDLGYATLYMPDHFGDQLGPLVGLAAAAEATSTLRVGPLVLGNDYRHPVVAAKEVATLDWLSGGRVEFGLGAGWQRSDYTEAGLAYDEPAVRVERLEEAVEVYRQLLGHGQATFHGRHYQVQDALGAPSPASPGGPALLIGGGGRRVLSLAAQRADIVGVNPNLRSGAIDVDTARSALADRYDQRVAWVREAAGSRFADLELQILTFVVQVGGDPRELARQMAPAMGVDEHEALAAPLVLVGTVDEICERLQERRQRWGVSYWVIHDHEMEAFAPVVERLAGT